MKRTFISTALCLAALCASAQSYEVRTLTFEDADYRGSGNVVGGNDWSSLIDDAEYNGSLLYGDGKDTYMWYDENNTELVWDGLQGVEFWSGGAAISSYYEPDLTQGDYTRQLSIPLEKSDNQFVIVFSSENLKGYPSYSHCSPFYFADGKARIIESVDVINTTYALNSLTNGDGFAPAATEESRFVVHFEGTHEDGTTSEVTFLLADGREFVTDWTKVDLTPLGKVKQLRTYVTGSDDLEGEWGLNTPGYVALDNIRVRFETVVVTMNANTRVIKSLVNMATGEEVEVGTAASGYKYTFYDLPEGSYLLTGTASDGETVSGTIQLDVDADHTAFSIYSPQINVKNADWVYGTDYTLNLKVTDAESNIVNTTFGQFTNGRRMFMVFNGNTYYLDLIPSEEHQAEGYLPVSYTGTVSFNATVTAEAPMSAMYAVSVPAGATFFLGTKTAHFVKFKEIVPESVETEGGSKVYTYRLADKQQYNYRVTAPGKLTQAGLFTMSTDETKRPVLAFTDEDLTAKDPKCVDHDATSNDGYNVGDLFLNINPAGHLQLAAVGDTYDILPMRNWELTNSITGNYFIEPDFHFTVVNMNGQEDASVVKVEDEVLTAVGEGTAIVLVTYDAIRLTSYSGATAGAFAGGNDWGAIWPENTGIFVVTVGQQATGITPNIIINKDYLTTVTPWGGGAPIDTKLSMENVDAEFDVLYYLDTEDGFDYTFSPEGVSSVTLARPTIGANAASYAGFSAEGVTDNADGSYTLHLTMGRNIVRLTGADGKSLYQVITAKPCHRDILVGGDVVESVKPGDAVTVQYSGLYHPAGKLAGIHNFSAGLSYKQASEGLTVKDATKNQYKMASTSAAQAVTFTVPADWTTPTIELTDGVMGISGFGDPVGNHRATSKLTGRAPNFTAISQSAVFGRVPSVNVKVNVPTPEDEGVRTLTFEDSDYKGTTENYAGKLDWSSLIDQQYGGPMLYPEDFDEDEGDILYYWYDEGNTEVYSELVNAYMDGCFWAGGIAISNYVDADLTHGDSTHQLAVPTSNGSKNFAVVYCNSNSTISANNPQTTLSIVDGKLHVIESMKIAPTLYQLAVAKGGNGYAKALTGDDDYLTLTIHGMQGDEAKTALTIDMARAGKYLEDWTTIDLTSLGEVDGLMFTMDTNDQSYGYANQPTYFAFDDLKVRFDVEASAPAVATFEDVTIEGEESFSKGASGYTTLTSGSYQFDVYCDDSWGTPYYYAFCAANYTGNTYDNDYNGLKNVVGSGYNGSANYGAFFNNYYGQNAVTVLSADGEGAVVPGFYITNSAYAYSSMTGGDPYAKKFDQGDWFLLTITGYDADGEVTGTKEFYLADLRDADKAYIISDWRYCDLSTLGKVKTLNFALSSSDNGDYGMNTPAYFCLDDFGAEGEEVLPEKNITTGINDIPDVEQSVKGTLYDLQGRRVAKPTHGLYIVNGKKLLR